MTRSAMFIPSPTPTAIRSPRRIDVRRRLASEANGAGETTTYTVDGNGNRIGKIRPLGQADNASAWSYSYDGANRLIEVDDPLAHATHYGYNKNGNRTTPTTRASA